MQDYLNQLSENLIFDCKELKDNVLYIYCHIKNTSSHKIHSYMTRSINDINYGNYKVVLVVKCFTYYIDRKVNNRTIAFQPDFIDGKTHRTKRLTDFILNSSKESSAIGLERTLKNITNISDSTILRLIKKNSNKD